ncbi:MAG: radical SAM family heme chaperone HemW [Planctomycetota bacterium]
MDWPRAVYIHVPFCLHHCGYCDFTLVANRDHLIPEYLRLLELEIRHLSSDISKPYEVDTIFIGGGTPTHLSIEHLQTLLEVIHGSFRLSQHGEYSIEANPDGLCNDRLDLLSENGVSRISLGVQSFDEAVLKTLERRHSREAAIDAIQRSAERFADVSLDLIFGVPGQSLESWEETLQTAISMPVQHISTYGLTYEQGTPFFRRERSGDLQRVADVHERDMYLVGIRTLSKAGFGHYEVSNFARPGFQCRHNRVYWNADEYFAFGPGAARYLHGERSTNVRSVVRWLKALQIGADWIEDREVLTPEEKAREAIMIGLRMMEGLDIARFEQRFATSLAGLASEPLDRHLAQGHLVISHGRLRLTLDGLLIADTVVSDFL